MLFRYARHVAQGHGIVWNVGDPPLGAPTDVTFMLVIALCHYMGLSIEAAARSVGTVAHVFTVCLIYLVVRVRNGPRWAALLSAMYVAIGPSKAYIASGFGTTLFAAVASVVWVMALGLADAATTRRAVVFALGVIALGITRPEGVMLGTLMWAGVLAYHRATGRPSRIVAFLVTALVAGSAYLALRWWYFGDLLPIPYYKKGAFHIYWANLLIAAKYTSLLLGPMLLVPLFSIHRRHVNPTFLLAAVPIVGFGAIWILLSNEMNFFRRFEYPVVPLAAMVWPECVDGRWFTRMRSAWAAARAPMRLAVAGAIGACTVIVAGYQHTAYTPPFWQDTHWDLGRLLQPLRNRGYVMAVTEAGLLPFYSEWRAVDTWGLNDRWIARHGRVTEDYLSQYRPHLIVFHAYYSPAVPRQDDSEWARMDAVLQQYAESHGYALVGVLGKPDDAMYYYVRTGVDGADEITAIIEAWARRQRVTNVRAGLTAVSRFGARCRCWS